MATFFQLFLRSFETGAVYGLATLGIIIVFRTNALVNFAQGVMGMFGAYVITFAYSKGVPIIGAILIGVVAAIALGFVVDFVIIRRTKKVSGAGKEIITLGLMMVILGLVPIIFGVEPLKLGRVIADGSFNVFGANISYNSVLNIFFGIGITVLLFFLIQKSKLGLAIRSTASNEKTAKLMGVPTALVTLFAWAVAVVLGSLSGAMVAPATSVSINLMDSVQVCAFIACVLGGFQTFYGPVIGAYIIAIANNMLSYYVSSVWGTQILYIIIMVFIVFKPVGLFGKRTIKKV